MTMTAVNTPNHRSSTSSGIVNDNDYFDDDTYDETIATYLSQCDPPYFADDDLLSLQPSNSTFNDGRVSNQHQLTLLQKIGVSLMPTIWLANLACNFRSACECCECNDNASIPALGSTRNATTTREKLNDKKCSKNETNSSMSNSNSAVSSSASPSTLLPCVPREFTSKEHHRFDALQRMYHTAIQLRFKDTMGNEEGGTKPIIPSHIYQLSPRLIIHDLRKRTQMRHKLISYLESRARDTEVRLLQDLEKEAERTHKVKEEKEWKRQWQRLQKKNAKKAKEEAKAIVDRITAVQSNASKKNKNNTKQPTTTIDSSGINKTKDDFDEDQSYSVRVWCCDYCNRATFPTFDEAVRHEELCKNYLERKKNNIEEAEAESESESDGEGEAIERILRKSSSALENQRARSIEVVLNAVPPDGEEDNVVGVDTQNVNDSAERLVVATSAVASENNVRINGATTPVLVTVKMNSEERHDKVYDLQKENERPKNENRPLSMSPSCSPVDATKPVPISGRDIARDFMKTATIDYDDRVNGTALPEPYVNTDLEPDEPLGPTTISENVIETLGTAKDGDASSLLRLSTVTYQNKILTAQNNFLTQQNQSLLSANEELQCQLAAVKRQTVEAIQQVQLKAYIAETALSAARDRASVMENLLVNIITDVAADEVVEQEVRESIATYSSMMISQNNHESARRSMSLCSGSPPLSPQHESSASSSMNSHKSHEQSASSKDFWGWMFRNKTDVGVSSSTATAFVSDHDVLSRLRRGNHA